MSLFRRARDMGPRTAMHLLLASLLVLDPAVWPDQVGQASSRAATIEKSPPGPAVMAYSFGTTDGPAVELTPLVLAARDDVYRRSGTAQDRSSAADQGAPAPMLLSPDGQTLAVGSTKGDGTIELVDLSSGEKTTVSLPYVTSGIPTAFDPHNDALWVRARATKDDSGGTTTYDDWEWQRVDLTDASATRARGLDRAVDVAVVPGGEQLAVRRSATQVQLFSVDGLEPAGDPISVSGEIEPGGVSPDGRRLATGSDGTVRVYALTDPDADATSIEVDGVARVHAWTGDDTLVVSRTQADGAWLLEEVDLSGGESSTITTYPASGQGPTVSEVSLATGLLEGMETREAGEVDDGSAPVPLWTLVATGLGLGALGVLWWRRRDRARNT